MQPTEFEPTVVAAVGTGALRVDVEGAGLLRDYRTGGLPSENSSVTDPVLAQFRSRALYPERWKISKILLNEYSR